MILCLWSHLHPLSKLLAIQDHTQNLEKQLWMGGRREVSIIFYRPVTRSDLKQERSFFRGSVSSFLQLVVADVHSSCLFGAESYSGQRQRKSVWQGLQSEICDICELVSGKLSKCLYIHSYTHLITSSELKECLLIHNFQNNCSTECHW